MRTLRVALAAAMLACCLLNAVPVVTADSTPMCQLECCAGRAPHAAGSCMHGSCHVDLSSKRTSHHHKPSVLPANEPLCGLSDLLKKAQRNLTVTSLVVTDDKQSTSKSTTASSATLSRSCNSDCGGCVSGITSSNRLRGMSGFTHAAYARPPSSIDFGDVRLNLIRQRRALHRQFAPRPPPVSLS